MTVPWTSAGLFAGIGGVELGLQRAGVEAELLCECWEPARAVLEARFPGVPVAGDVRDLEKLPPVDVVAAGFPCTDLSQAGLTRGIDGAASGLVAHVFRLLDARRVPWVVLENVRNMLALDGGRAMSYLVERLEELGYRWAYRTVDSRFAGVPQRRQRVIVVAALDGDPSTVLFADETGERHERSYADDVFGFYWTEGLRGLGWARDAVPTLKGGSTVGIPSPPAIWAPNMPPGRRIVTPSVQEAERLQGFARNWTAAATSVTRRNGVRWKLVGNAVTVGVAEWVGRRLVAPGPVVVEPEPLRDGERWPIAASGESGARRRMLASMWPQRARYKHLADVVDLERVESLSSRATAGFLARAERSTLRFVPGFLDDVRDHLAFKA